MRGKLGNIHVRRAIVGDTHVHVHILEAGNQKEIGTVDDLARAQARVNASLDVCERAVFHCGSGFDRRRVLAGIDSCAEEGGEDDSVPGEKNRGN